MTTPAVTVEALAAALTGREILVALEADGTPFLAVPARPHDLAVQLLSAVDLRLTDDPQEPHAADSAAQLRYERDQLVGVNDNLRSQLGRARAALGKLADDGNLQAADLLTDLAVVQEPHAAPGGSEVRTCYCGTTAMVVPGVFPHPDCDGSVLVQPAPELPESEARTFRWDHRQPAPVDEIAAAVRELSGGAVRMRMPETAELVISRAEPQPPPEAARDLATGDGTLRSRITRLAEAWEANSKLPEEGQLLRDLGQVLRDELSYASDREPS